MNTQVVAERKVTNGKAIASVMIGVLSILGIFLVGEVALISIAGLFLSMVSLRETKKYQQNGSMWAGVGLIFNGIAIISLFF
ncbi:hypothetical protein [Fredinandcohnia quinoae]|uniref:DUF4190 domain-containing protein n=1 Tax=Fredinandcohnia quinoae TaxID=2918902 RepID=A0AAW5E972_9BACI|nr:hypothetical protein [Fredinandcohnia sp. SECRCQ15]MCH1627785.1 hypothetical protein [Fredinandcohnia sp. SECRCQ15]